MPSSPYHQTSSSSFINSSHMHSTPKQSTPSQRFNQSASSPSSSSGGYRTNRNTHHVKSMTTTTTSGAHHSLTPKSPSAKRETHKDYLYGLNDAIIVEEVPIIVSVAPNGVYCTTVATTIQTPTLANNSFFPNSPSMSSVPTTAENISQAASNSQNEPGNIFYLFFKTPF